MLFSAVHRRACQLEHVKRHAYSVEYHVAHSQNHGLPEIKFLGAELCFVVFVQGFLQRRYWILRRYGAAGILSVPSGIAPEHGSMSLAYNGRFVVKLPLRAAEILSGFIKIFQRSGILADFRSHRFEHFFRAAGNVHDLIPLLLHVVCKSFKIVREYRRIQQFLCNADEIFHMFFHQLLIYLVDSVVVRVQPRAVKCIVKLFQLFFRIFCGKGRIRNADAEE